MVIELEKKPEEKEIVEPEKKPAENLPPEGSKEVEVPDKARELELENAKLQARLDERDKLAEKEKPAPSIDSQYEESMQTKKVVQADAQSMDDDAFQEKYKMSKASAETKILDYELQYERAKNASERAFLRAENDVAKKYGDKYAKYQNQIEESINDLAPAVRQDPKKLSAHMERSLKSFIADEPVEKPIVKKKEAPNMDKRVVDTGFDSPAVIPDRSSKNEEPKDDQVAEPDRKLASMFGITSEKERKALKSTPYVEMNFGHGKVFRDPSKGFEKVK